MRHPRARRRTGSGTAHAVRERLETRVPGLDTILGGGLLRPGLFLLTGSTGAGKTVLAHQLCFAQAEQGRGAGYVTLMAESHASMLHNMETLAFFDRSCVGDGLWYVSGTSVMRERGLDGLYQLIEDEVRRRQPALLVIEGADVMTDVSSSRLDFQSFLSRLRALLELVGGTALLSMSARAVGDEPVCAMADGVFELRQRSLGLRTLREVVVRKLRGSVHLEGGHVFEIDARGAVFHPRTESLLATLPYVDWPSHERKSLGEPRLDEMTGGGLPVGTVTAQGSESPARVVREFAITARGIRVVDASVGRVPEARAR